ncbi:MAG: flagellar hook assembly protein FlgD [Burkholderiaceae bacterium]|nr:flagellar hook assembly protein FlgD [Burkholderiaceae bacterium]MEB2350380.1 flagellar hook assembly protein FlgD [Burkholderiaceae bacterium]
MNTIDTSGGARAAASATAATTATAGSGAAVFAGATAGADTAAATEDRFLRLLVAQMRNQDPLNPLDNAQVTSQLAQINTVRGIEQLNASMAKMAAASGEVSPFAAVGLLGRQVLVAGDTFEWKGAVADVTGGPPGAADASVAPAATAPAVRLGFELPADARMVHVEIVDATGRVVRAYEPAGVAPGVHTFEWDGTHDDGTRAVAGSYRLRAVATGHDGAALAIATLAPARVTGIAQAAGGARVELGGRPAVATSAIRAVL